MGPDHSKPRTQLGEYLALLSQRDATGRPFIIHGGQAANFWAALYLPREPRLQQHLPLTSIRAEPAALALARINQGKTTQFVPEIELLCEGFDGEQPAEDGLAFGGDELKLNLGRTFVNRRHGEIGPRCAPRIQPKLHSSPLFFTRKCIR